MSLQAVIPLFPKFTALDGIGPYEVLQRIPEIDITFIAAERGIVRSENGMLGIEADATFEEMPSPDLIVFPGGHGTRALVEDESVLEWVRSAHAGTTYTTSVCTGSLVLAAAGLLDGLTATTHWGARDVLTQFGAIPVPDRVVEHLDRRIITAAGVSSGIDMAFATRGVAVRPHRRRGGPADDRVRPAAALRHRLTRQVDRRDHDPCHRIRRAPRLTRTCRLVSETRRQVGVGGGAVVIGARIATLGPWRQPPCPKPR